MQDETHHLIKQAEHWERKAQANAVVDGPIEKYNLYYDIAQDYRDLAKLIEKAGHGG